MNKLLKKLLICGASLLIISSLGTGINNVSARRVRRYHPHTHRVAMTSKSLYKLAYRQSSSYISLLSIPFESDKPVSKSFGLKIDHARQSLINNIIRYHFNKSYIHGLYPLNSGHNFGEENNKNGMVQSAKKYAKKINHKNAHKYVIKHTHRNIKHSVKYKKYKSTKSITRNKSNNHIRRIKKYRKHTKIRNKHHLHKFNNHMNKRSTKKVSTFKKKSKKIPFMDISLGNGVSKVTPKIKSIFAKQSQIEMLRDINLARSKSGLKPLMFSNELTSQANKDASDYMNSDYIDSTYGAIGVNPNNDSENLLQSTLVYDPIENHDIDTNSYGFNGKSEHSDSDNDGMSYLNDNGTDDADEDMDDIFSDNVHDNYEDEGLREMKDNVLNPNYTSVGIGTADNYSNNDTSKYDNDNGSDGYGHIFIAQLFN